MLSHWAYILVGNNDTGKTTFQKRLVAELCGKQFVKLRRNYVGSINHPRAPRRLSTLFVMNRSLQEMRNVYKTPAAFFANGFKDADICVLSSHADLRSMADIKQMIEELRRRCYNVASVFFSNGYDDQAPQISCLPWQERLWVENPERTAPLQIAWQLDRAGREFVELLLARSSAQ